MRIHLWLAPAVLLASCVSHQHQTASGEDELEARRYEEADVRAEVDSRTRDYDFRFKGWQESMTATVTILPGVTEADGRLIESLGVPEAEVLYVQGLDPFVVADQHAYDRKMKAMFDYMQRFNQELLARIRSFSKLPRRPIQSAQTTPVSAPR